MATVRAEAGQPKQEACASAAMDFVELLFLLGREAARVSGKGHVGFLLGLTGAKARACSATVECNALQRSFHE